ncbi:hypothetical protein RDWZM_005450 [Blomia tropicalis]|uniref:Uncharacterized protein n=1 Tax=Blomia tropicalis TaxID=40697 RepID=A0A9Q0RKV6_BLOTA|nr:hypothetical protein RDWZM_005450 [Blomia tropicalis]
MFNSRIRRCAYQMMKEMIIENGTGKAKFRYKINLFMFMYGTFRLLATIAIIRNKFQIHPLLPYNISRDDALVSYFLQNSERYQEDILVMMLLFAFFWYSFQNLMYRLNVNKNVWRWWYQLIVVNQDIYYQYYEENYQTIEQSKFIEVTNMFKKTRMRCCVPKLVVNAYIRLLAKYTIHIKLHHLENKSFFNKKLLILPNLSNELRSLIVNFLIVWDYFAFFVQVGGCLTTITGYIYGIINMDNSGLSWFGWTWINLEFILVLNVALEIYQIGLFFTLLTIVASITYCGHIIQVNQKILKLMSKCRHRLPLRPLILWRNRSVIAFQLFEHNRVTSLHISANREMFGRLLYLFIMTNIPGNVYMIRRIFFGKHELIDMVLTWAMVFFQLLVCTVIFGPLAHITKLTHSPNKYIPTLQPMLRQTKGWLWYKIKYEDLFHRLVDNGPKLAITIGPLTPVTYRNFFEVPDIYNTLGGCLMTLTGCIYGIINMDNSGLSWFGWTWISLEFILALNVALEIYQIGLFFTLTAIVASITYCGHIIQVNQKILKLMSKCRHRLPLRPLILWRNRSVIAYQLFEHNRVTSLLISGNREMFGHLLYLFIMTNIPGNVYMIRRIFFGKHELIDMVLTWAMVFFQLLVCTVVFGPLAHITKMTHSPNKYIPTLQPMLRQAKGWLWFKIKYEDLYHRLVDNGPKLAITIGPLTPITYKNFFEAIFVYIGYLLLAFGLNLK